MILRKSLLSCYSCYLNVARNFNHITTNNSYKIKLRHNKLYTNTTKSASYNVNTNVIKDVILFKYENPKQFKMMNVFAICQFAFWSYLSHFAFTTLKDAPVNKTSSDAPWWRKINLGENKYRNGVTVISFLMGKT